ncbi:MULTISPECIES: YafY family protein [unclassified Kitasatospora]|uniref:helix-turn-helix transcriptional regulator n=1 Tax=unclassified Kitasatospora TaxID=2633591 RepID=UPI00070D942A|nr:MULTISPECIES: YafY family protein [unclassified Kitasatospora]KQV19197.1 DNA-binding transcriptional regulator [Kitasatospora sp. Root107]KRB75551.1 DNA-binding transcriptional regulator [Kitasatospora sp. Root187]
MLATSARLLRLLSLLQSRTDWTGAELAERLGVSPRTIRYDVDKLRGLGYPVHATSGVAGGYRLGAGAALPPLLLDDEEAVAVAASLRTAAGGSVAGIEETSVRALAKLEQVLPHHLSRRVAALHGFTVTLPPVGGTGPAVSADVLATLAAACRDQRRLRFDYRRHDGDEAVREVEPYRLVHTGHRWYLVAWDVAREDWRTFRVDRLSPRLPHGARFAAREEPPADLVPRGVDTALSHHRARVTVHAPAAAIRARMPAAILVEPVDDTTCIVHAGADTVHRLALHILMLDTEFEVDGPPELLAELHKIASRAGAAIPRDGGH